MFRVYCYGNMNKVRKVKQNDIDILEYSKIMIKILTREFKYKRKMKAWNVHLYFNLLEWRAVYNKHKSAKSPPKLSAFKDSFTKSSGINSDKLWRYFIDKKLHVCFPHKTKDEIEQVKAHILMSSH
ncbi:MAG: hypothetical protein GY679_01550 [Mycoplasma sp.]|nr:hypothetical protein [Mycoplasma sp.]